MNKIWLEPESIHVPDRLREAVGGHRLVAETLTRRGITDVTTARAFLDAAAYTPAPALDLPDMEKGVKRIAAALKHGETICVWGDFDVDGQTSTALLVSALKQVGAQVIYHIPNRATEGHGINISLLSEQINRGARVVLTCDTGITAHEAIDYASQRGIDVVVTDHHQLAPTLPNAYASINPQRVPAAHPLHTLPGVGCAYKFIEALYDELGSGDPTPLLDLVALGIVADVATQTGDARYLLQRGLDVLRSTGRIGLQALIETAGLNPERLTEEHIGFMIGPRLNALGRLSDANEAVELLTTHDLERARVLANVLEGLNAQRKLYSEQVFDGAQAMIAANPKLLKDYSVLVLANPHWHTGVVGIVASRLVEQYNKPVILLRVPEDGIARGSARSVDGCDITAGIAANGHLLRGFGGHAAAAGLSLEAERIDEFRAALSHTVRQMLGDDIRPAQLPIGGYVELGEISLELVAEIERLAPFGAGNPPLVLVVRDVRAQHIRAVGRDGDHLQVTVEDAAGAQMRAIWWNGAGMPQPLGRFDLAFTLRASDFRGERRVEMEFIDFRLRESMAELLAPKFEVIDWRAESAPLAKLAALRREQPRVQVWSEAETRAEVNGKPRGALDAGEALALWTIPPGAGELQALVGQVSPKQIYLFGIDPGMDEVEPFLTRLGGLVKYALRQKKGAVGVSQLAAQTAQRAATVRAGLRWLVAQGAIALDHFDGESVVMRAGAGMLNADELSAAAGELRALLNETAAYRRQFMRAANPL